MSGVRLLKRAALAAAAVTATVVGVAIATPVRAAQRRCVAPALRHARSACA